MSFVEPLDAFFAQFRDSARHYPVSPEQVDAWLGLPGNSPTDIDQGELITDSQTIDFGSAERVVTRRSYEMLAATADELGIKAGHTLEVRSVRYLINGEPEDKEGLYRYRLAR